MAAVEVRDLSFRYGTTAILRSISMDVQEGSFHILLGKNGSGKSTLVRVLAGVAPCPRGVVRIFGDDIAALSAARRAKTVGYLPQRHQVVFPFSVEDVVMTGRAGFVRFVPAIEDRKKVAEVLERIGIEHLRERVFTELSGGEQQIVMIARVLAQEPRIILLDEPTSHLDVANQAKLLDLLRELIEWGLTVVAVLHDPNIAFLYGTAFTGLKDGRALPIDPDMTLWDSPFLEDLYGVPMTRVPYGEKAFILPTPRGTRRNG